MSNAAPVLSKPRPKAAGRKRTTGKPKSGAKAKPKSRPVPAAPPVPAPPPAPAARGLCATCVHGESCTFARDPSIRIAECQEFDGGAAAPAPAPVGVTAAAAPSRNPAAGLCATCEGFAACTLHRPEAGVWRCEEFR